MSGQLVLVCSTTPTTTTTTNTASSSFQHSYSDACYFIVMELPAMCGARVCQEHVRSPLGRGPELAHDTLMEEEVGYNARKSGVATDLENDTGASREGNNAGIVVVITVDTVSGQLLHAGIPQKDLFASMSDAMRAIPALCSRTPFPFEVRVVCEFVAFAGGCLTEETINLLFIESSTLIMGGNGTTFHAHAVGEEADLFSFSPMNRCIPPIFSVDKAGWVHIPLRIAVSALQQPFTSSGVHSWTLDNRSSTLCNLSSSVLDDDAITPYLYFSPGVDVTHCCVLEDAVRRLLVPFTAGSDRTNLPNTNMDMDGNSVLAPPHINELFPPLPKQAGRDALGQCDCLWNEELIRFCGAFGLGDWCCRLALGSCTAITLPRSFRVSSVALLVVRLSRLAVSGCFYDYTPSSAKVQLDPYVSALETEFQLLILHEPLQNQTDEKKLGPISSLTWRRGTDFAGHKNIVEQNERFKECAERFVDPLPPCEDHVAGIFAAYLERYGSGTKISLAHAGTVLLKEDNIAREMGQFASSYQRSMSPIKTRKSPNKWRGLHSSSPKRRTSLVTNLANAAWRRRKELDVSAVDLVYANKNLQSVLQSLAGHVKAHGLRPVVTVGALFPVFPSCSVLPSLMGINSDAASVNDGGGFLQTFWGRESLQVTRSKMADSWVPRVCVGDDTQVSIIASIIVSVGWVVSWLVSELDEEMDVAELLLESRGWVRDIILLVANSAATTSCIRTAFLKEEAMEWVWCCLIEICKGAPVAFSPVVWTTAQRIEQMIFYARESGSVSSDKEDHDGDKSGVIINRTVHKFLMTFFLSEGGFFFPRELVRHRIVLLSHPSRLSSIINVQMLVPPSKVQGSSAETLDEEESSRNNSRVGLFPLTPMHHSNPPVECDEELPLVSCSGTGPTPTLSMLQGLMHPFSQPLCMPLCFEGVEFTISLPSLSYITHLALLVANSIQMAPYAAALSISLSTSCYVGQTHERSVLEDVSLPLCVSSRSSFGRQISPHLIFFELHRPSTEEAPLSFVEEVVAGVGTSGRSFNQNTPVVARYMRLSIRGSGCNPMALPPILVFGEPVDCIPYEELHAVVGCQTKLSRMLFAARSLFAWEAGDKLTVELTDLKSHFSVLTAAAQDGDKSDKRNSHTEVDQEEGEAEKQGPVVQKHAGAPRLVGTSMSRHGRQEMYLQKVNSVIPADLFQLNFELTVAMESKRLQSHMRRFYRDVSLYRTGVPRWVMNPAYQVLPRSAFYRSQLPEEAKDTEFIRYRQKKQGGTNGEIRVGTSSSAREKKKVRMRNEERKRCALCLRVFSWFSGAKECDRCQRHVCEKCMSENRVRLPELGIHDCTASVCLACSKKVLRLEGTLKGFLWSEASGEVESDVEKEETIDFYVRCTTPQLESVLALYPLPVHSSYAHASVLRACDKRPYQLTMHPLTRVVNAPGMDDENKTLFEEVLGVMGFNKNLLRWRCVTEDEWTDSITRVSRHVILLLPHGAAVSHGILRYMLSGNIRGTIEVQLYLGNSLHSLEPFYGADIGSPGVSHDDDDDVTGVGTLREVVLQREGVNPSREEEGKVIFSTSTPVKNTIYRNTGIDTASTNGATTHLAALFFIGSVSDLLLLHVDHFSLWGRFTSEEPHVNSSYYNCSPDVSRYGGLSTNMIHGTSGVLGVACLPRMLPMTSLVPLRNVTLHNCEKFLIEFDFGVPVTVCGFTLELYHPALMTGGHDGIATALRLIGVTASGYRGNMGIFKLPWPPLLSLSSSSSLLSDASLLDIFSYAYGLPSTSHGVVSVLVEVVEWRLAPSAVVRDKMRKSGRMGGSARSHGGGGGLEKVPEPETSSRRGIYLGRLQFWTSANADTQRMVCSHTYIPIHAALDDTHC
ncbi:hypothetical protein MOQ_001889 [Trypanosoma cruzi marinkellei]|uniref:Uncharacterized protein n=1 Tax=Trypanosoma cruzi marinkellei TaxID=85056 RepID=K2MRG5_TRYCR|nr:hypothetical protein MOQ_001889 [Trypanosoma cruzi marinkellei]